MPGTDARFTDAFVHRLNRAERQILMLYYAEELSPAEIGMVLDVPEPRVVSTLDALRVRARTALEACTV